MKNSRTLALAGALILPIIMLQGCSTMSSMDTRNMADTPTKTFAADKLSVVRATEVSVIELGYALKDTRVSEPTTQILFSKPMSAFSWGEVGRIDVTGLNTTGVSGSSVVSIASEKRYNLQITGMSQKEFAKKIFDRIETHLPK